MAGGEIKIMDCPSCGYKLEEGLKSCLQCGHEITKKVFRPDRFAPMTLRIAAFIIDMILCGPIAYLLPALGGDLIKGSLPRFIAGYIIYAIYGTVFETSPLQATPGKLLMRIRVIRVNGSNMGLKFGFLRNLTKILSIMTMVGAVMAFINDGKQAVHDLFGRDYVIYKKDA